MQIERVAHASPDLSASPDRKKRENGGRELTTGWAITLRRTIQIEERSVNISNFSQSATIRRRLGGRGKKVLGAQNNLADLRAQRDALKSKANKTPEDKAALEKVNKAINREIDRAKKSETHSRKEKGEQ